MRWLQCGSKTISISLKKYQLWIRPGWENCNDKVRWLSIDDSQRRAPVSYTHLKADGAADIPTASADDASATVTAKQEEFISSVGAPGVINLPVHYAADGSWTVAGMTDTDWANATGDPIWQSYRMKPEIIAMFKEKGVKELTLSLIHI